MSMRGTVEYATRHEHESPGEFTGELMRDEHGITIWVDVNQIAGETTQVRRRVWVPYTSIAFVRLEHGSAVQWSEREVAS